MTTIPLCPSMKSMMNISKSLITSNPLLSPLGGLFKLEKTIRAVIKRWGWGFLPATMNILRRILRGGEGGLFDGGVLNGGFMVILLSEKLNN